MKSPSEKEVLKKYELRDKNPYKSITGKERMKGRSEGYWQMDAAGQLADDRRIGFFAANETLGNL